MVIGKTRKFLSPEQKLVLDIKKENEKLNKKIDKLRKTIEVFETKIKINQEFFERQENKPNSDNQVSQ